MDHIKNLVTIFDVLDTQWRKLTSDMTKEELSNLNLEHSGFKNDIESINNINDIDELSKDFIEKLSKVESLEFLTNINKPPMRSGNLTEIVEEIRIKIINYCVTFQDKINTFENIE